MPRTPSKTLPLILLCATPLLGGCRTTKTVLLRDDEPVRLAETVRAYVFADLDGDGVMERTQNRVPLDEGKWVVPDVGEPVPTTEPTR